MQAGVLFLWALISLAIDQASKALVMGQLRMGGVASLGPLRLRCILNSKTAIDIERHGLWLVALWVAVAVALAALVQFGPLVRSTAPIALGMALGGAGSNLIDRFHRGGVLDFVDLRFWPVFNLADVAIVLGISAGVLSLWR